MYGEQCLVRCTIFQCGQRYEAGRINIKDLPCLRQVHVVTNSAIILALDELKGEHIPPSVKEGDKVLLPEYGGTKIEVNEKEMYIFRDSDILGKWSE
ncbi:hypothetical protein AVEN_158338-1 [Araneus ventricosus]|uniref:10 kDa heat shock protein, mitochondrial n=1 Tax=Araneus ventricosus TaxID=182803 RepID=A0A4Y2MS70_ARAVE|nr:hypothetical protein AVEN_158338-1 [Araneus ventricosus]